MAGVETEGGTVARPDPELEFSGLRFKASEVKSITIERDGNEIFIQRKEPQKQMGFRQ